MLGQMQNRPLLVSSLIEHAETNHASVPIVSLTVEGEKVRTNYGELALRTRKVAQALEKLGAQHGDRIGTLAWNTHRHVEAWYGISGMGCVTHTINPRLFPEQIAYIATHAEDRFLLLDLSFVPIIEGLADQLKNIEAFIILTDKDHMPDTSLSNVLCYEELLGAENGNYDWPQFDENTAAGLCYTSGTTGNPKGVLYSHRSNVLHSFAVCFVDTLAISSKDCVLPIVPMFHANAWGMPYAATAAGAKLTLNGPHFDAETLHKLLEDEKVTMTAAVPTVWLGLLNYLEETGRRVDHLQRVTIGGAAAPRSMIEAFEVKYGVEVNHAWGMTEMSPLGTVGTLTAAGLDLPLQEQIDLKTKQGHGIYGVEMCLMDDDGNQLPRDGKTFGHLMVRGHWVISSYFKGDGGDVLDKDGWFDTGDVATIDPMGYMHITDRSKDVIKSGGEWISTIDLENAAVGHPDVAEAAVIGAYHPKWDERPLLIVVKKAGSDVAGDAILDHIRPQVAKWWMPDDVAFVDEIPHSATGKILKTALREQFKDYKLPTY